MTKTETERKPYVGMIFESSWGYDQTNVDFYMAVDVSASGKTVKLRKVALDYTEQAGPHDKVVPSLTNGESGAIVPKFLDTAYPWCRNCGQRIQIGRWGDTEGKLIHARTQDTNCGADPDDRIVVRGTGKAQRPKPKILTKRVREYDGRFVVTIASYANAYEWDGSARYQTGQGYGH